MSIEMMVKNLLLFNEIQNKRHAEYKRLVDVTYEDLTKEDKEFMKYYEDTNEGESL